MSATAWRLFSPSTSGGKVYDILLVDCYVLVGWGSVSGTKQYKIERFTNAREASAFAVAQTEAKERKGYELDGTVHQALDKDRWYIDLLASRYVHRGSSSTFDKIFNDTYSAGARLG